MARKNSAFDGQITHPVVSISLLAALIAATFAIISALCAGRFWKKGTPQGARAPSPARSSETENPPPDPDETIAVPPAEIMESGSESTTPEAQLPLKLPPARQPLKESPSRLMNNNDNAAETTGHQHQEKRHLSMKGLGSLSIMKNFSKRGDNNDNNEKKYKEQDSIWRKQIILGEKCRVPAGGGDEDDEALTYDDQGNRISIYHPRTHLQQSSVLSRSTSEVDLLDNNALHPS